MYNRENGRGDWPIKSSECVCGNVSEWPYELIGSSGIGLGGVVAKIEDLLDLQMLKREANGSSNCVRASTIRHGHFVEDQMIVHDFLTEDERSRGSATRFGDCPIGDIVGCFVESVVNRRCRVNLASFG